MPSFTRPASGAHSNAAQVDRLERYLAEADAEAAAKAEEDSKKGGGVLGVLKKGLGSLGKAVSLPGAVFVNIAAEAGDLLGDLSGRTEGDFDLGDIGRGIAERKGVGSIMHDQQMEFDPGSTRGKWGNRLVGGVLDIAADPLNLIAPGSSAAAKGAIAKVGGELGDAAAKAAWRSGGTGALREALGDLPLEEVLARGTKKGTPAGAQAVERQLKDLDRFAKGGIGFEVGLPGIGTTRRLTVGANKIDKLGAAIRGSELGKGVRAALLPGAKVADELGSAAEIGMDQALHIAGAEHHRLIRDYADNVTGKVSPEDLKRVDQAVRTTAVDAIQEFNPNLVSTVPKEGYVLVRETGEAVSNTGVERIAGKLTDPTAITKAREAAAEAAVKGDNVIAEAAVKAEKVAADHAAKIEQAAAKATQVVGDATAKGAKIVEDATAKAQTVFAKQAQSLADKVMKDTARIADGPLRQQQAALAIEAGTAGLRAEAEAAIAVARQKADRLVADATAKADELVPAAQAAADEALTKAGEAGAQARQKADKLTAAGQDKIAKVQAKQDELAASLEGRYIPKVMHDALEGAFSKKASEVLDGLDAVTSFTKRFTTLGPFNAIPHVMRNVMSNMLFATMYGGATKLHYWTESEKIGTALRKLALDETEVTAEALARQGLTPEQAQHALDMQKQGLAGHGAQQADDVGQLAAKRGSELGRLGKKANDKLKGHVVISADDLPGTRTAAAFNQTHEHISNGAVYLRGIEDGLSPAAAAQKARGAMLDYSSVGLSKFERDYLQRLIFFYKFPRRAIPAGVKFSIEHPGAAMAASRAGAGMDLGERSKYGNPIGNYFDTPLESTAQSLIGLGTNPVGDVVDRTNPILQAVLDDKKRGWGDILPPVGNTSSKLQDPKLVGTQPTGLLGTTYVPGMVRGVDYAAIKTSEKEAKAQAKFEAGVGDREPYELTEKQRITVFAVEQGIPSPYTKTQKDLLSELTKAGVPKDKLLSVLSQ